MALQEVHIKKLTKEEIELDDKSNPNLKRLTMLM